MACILVLLLRRRQLDAVNPRCLRTDVFPTQATLWLRVAPWITSQIPATAKSPRGPVSSATPPSTRCPSRCPTNGARGHRPALWRPAWPQAGRRGGRRGSPTSAAWGRGSSVCSLLSCTCAALFTGRPGVLSQPSSDVHHFPIVKRHADCFPSEVCPSLGHVCSALRAGGDSVQ